MDIDQYKRCLQHFFPCKSFGHKFLATMKTLGSRAIPGRYKTSL